MSPFRTLYSWGRNEKGQLGHSNFLSECPQKVLPIIQEEDSSFPGIYGKGSTKQIIDNFFFPDCSELIGISATGNGDMENGT